MYKLLSIIIFFCTFYPINAQSIELQLWSPFTQSGYSNIFLNQWSKIISEKSQNILKINIKNKKIEENQVVDLMNSQDLFILSPMPEQKGFSKSQPTLLPFLAQSGKEATKDLWALWKNFPDFQNEFKDFQIITMWSDEASLFFSKNELIKSPEQLKGKYVLVKHAYQELEVRSWGGNPVLLADNENLYTAFRDKAEILYMSVQESDPYSLFEMGKYLTVIPCSFQAYYLVMGKTSFDALEPSLQDLLLGFSGENLALAMNEVYIKSNSNSLKLYTQMGVTVYYPNYNELEQFKTLAKQNSLETWKEIFKKDEVSEAELWINGLYDFTAKMQ